MPGENPLYMAEDAGAADLISGGRLQLGISRGSPEQVIRGYEYFGHVPDDGASDADMARSHTLRFLEALKGEGFAEPNPRPMFPNPPGLLRAEPHSWGRAEHARGGLQRPRHRQHPHTRRAGAGMRVTQRGTRRGLITMTTGTRCDNNEHPPPHPVIAPQFVRLITSRREDTRKEAPSTAATRG